MKKFLAWFIVVTLMLSVLVGCGGANSSSSNSASSSGSSSGNSESKDTSKTDDQNKVTLTLWYSANEADPNDTYSKWMKENIELFEKAHPNIKLQPSVTSNGDQYLNKITTEMAANKAPDVFWTWLSGRLQPFVEAGRIYPLNDIIDNNPDLKNVLNPNNLDTATFDGKIYAIPYVLTGEVVYYNKEIFEKNGANVPQTWDELISLVKMFKSKGIIPMAMGNKDPFVGCIPYMMIFDRMFGPDKYKETAIYHKPKYDDPAYVEAAKKLIELRDAGAFPDNFNGISIDEGRAQFTSGKAAMYIMGTWDTATIIQTLGDKADFFNFPDIPGGKGSAKDGWIVNKDEGYAISQRSKYKDEGAEFIKFLFSKERLAARAETGALVAAINFDFDKSKIHPLTAKLMSTLANAKYGIIPWDNPLGQNMGKEVNLATQAILGGADIEQTFQKLQEIAKREWGSN